MKQIFTLVAGFLCLAATAQKQISFKPIYKPVSTYTQVMGTDMVMTFAQNEDEPMTQDMEMAITYVIKTAKQKKDGIPFTGQIQINAVAAGLNQEQQNSTDFYGKMVDSSIIIDSVATSQAGVTAALNDELKSAFGKALNQFEGAPATIKVGESFKTAKMPIDLPVGLGDDFDSGVTYTLKKIEGKKAYFDLLLDTPIALDIQGAEMKGKIKVSGTMTYETDTQYISSQIMDMDGGFTMNKGDLNLTMSITGKTTINTTVTPN